MSVTRLGYLGFGASDVPAWKRFLADLAGAGIAAEHADGSIDFRIDRRTHRISVHPDASDDLLYAGLECGSVDQIEAQVQALRDTGVEVHEAPSALAERRGVERLFTLVDPSGTPLELYCNARDDESAFESELVPSGFVTGDGGVGHIVIGAADRAVTEAFYRELLGMRLSDEIKVPFSEDFTLEISFLHANERHHSVAIASVPMPKRIDHFMVEVNDMNDVGRAWDRMCAAGVPMSRSLGQHPNDGMFSFYAVTPSGFSMEFGAGGVKIDDATWKTAEYDQLSTWGHHGPEAA